MSSLSGGIPGSSDLAALSGPIDVSDSPDEPQFLSGLTNSRAKASADSGPNFTASNLLGNDRIIGTPRRDVLVGGPGNDILIGGPGRDRLTGGPGNDLLNGGPGNDVLLGTLGRNTLIGSSGADLLLGGSGSDRLLAGIGNDRLFGLGGNDVLVGDAGNDIFSGGGGVDVIRTGVGRDRVQLQAGAGLDIVADFRNGQDKIVLGRVSFNRLNFRRARGGVMIQVGRTNAMLLQNTALGSINRADFV
ncbi:MAG: calcium-binding protein [Cyanobacteria bacterium P01_A01_bin.135]